MNENDRIPVEELLLHPFICNDYAEKPMTVLDVQLFEKDMAKNRHYSGFSSQYGMPSMPGRFDETQIMSGDVILTTKMSD